MLQLTPAEYERARTWNPEIAAKLSGSKPRSEGNEFRFPGHGGLSINSLTGAWIQHATGRGGYSAVGLVALLTDKPDEAIIWIKAWLAEHPGTGSCCTDANAGEEDGTPASAELARQALDDAIDITGTAGEVYLREHRRIDPPFPPDAKFVPNARCGEGAISALLYAHDRVVGVVVQYVTPDGEKSPVEPRRRRYALEKAADAVFQMPYEGENTDVVICEGLPDALSIWRCGAMRCRVLGLPGVDTLRHLKFPKGTKVTVVPDGDPEDSPARKALDAGVDALMLAECDVRRCTIPPVGWDANRFLVEHGVDGLKTFLSSAVPATLSFDGEIQRLAKLSKIDYERARKQAVKDLKDRDLGDIRVSILDDLVEKAREAIKRAAEKAAAGPDWSTVTGDPVELVVILDGILKELKRYVVAPETTLGVVTLWAAFTHLVHHPIISVQIAPRLAVQAKTPGSGKSVLLELLANVVHNPRLGSSFTASSILRIVGQVEPTMLLDEAHNVLRRDRTDELLAVCNASHRRSGAFVERSVQNPAGEWEVVRFSLWCTMALALNGDLPQEQQERSIVAWLDKVLAEAVPEQLENGVSPELVERQSELKVWARYLEELPKPVLPGILKRQPGRVSDNWRPLAGIAELAGGRWPGLVKDAIEAALTAEHEASTIERLLLSIRRAFDNLPTDYKTGKPVDRIATAELLKVLLVDVEEDWRTANRGREITQYWLRDSLRGLLKPPRAQKWETSEGGNRRHHRGYLRLQFENAWRTYLPEAAEYSSPPPSPATAGSAGSAEGIDNTGPTSATSSDGHTIVSAGNGDFAASTTADAELTAADAAADDSLDYSAISMTPAHTAGPADMVEGGKEKKRNGGDVSNGTARSNGDAPSSRKRTSKSSVDELVVATWRAHPDWSHIKIGKECAVTATKARRIIDAAKAAGDCESDDPGAQVPASSNNALVENAVTYFQEDVQHRSWILQRIGEEPRPLKGESAHVKWVVDFWNAGAAEQAEIARRIKALKLDA